VAEPEEPVAEIEEEKEVAATDDKKEGGLFGGLKDFYDQADSMAASQALLLYKKLEEVGVVEKITDETGLKVIGRDESCSVSDSSKATVSSGSFASTGGPSSCSMATTIVDIGHNESCSVS
jgi:hypothetical protein